MRSLLAVLVLLLAGLPAVAQAAPYVHAHRGGSLTEGVATLPESSLPAFERARPERQPDAA